MLYLGTKKQKISDIAFKLFLLPLSVTKNVTNFSNKLKGLYVLGTKWQHY